MATPDEYQPITESATAILELLGEMYATAPSTVFDSTRCSETVKRLEQLAINWVETARSYAKNEEFYRDLLDQCAEHIGDDAFINDAGERTESPVRLKIPDLVKGLRRDNLARLFLSTDIAARVKADDPIAIALVKVLDALKPPDDTKLEDEP